MLIIQKQAVASNKKDVKTTNNTFGLNYVKRLVLFYKSTKNS